MIYTPEFLLQVQSTGTLGYDIQKVINVCDVPEEDVEEFTSDFMDTSTPVYKAYKKGVDKSDYVIDIKLFQMAQQGNLKALEKYEQRQAYRK